MFYTGYLCLILFFCDTGDICLVLDIFLWQWESLFCTVDLYLILGSFMLGEFICYLVFLLETEYLCFILGIFFSSLVSLLETEYLYSILGDLSLSNCILKMSVVITMCC